MGTILLYALASAIIASGIYYLVWRYVLNLSGPSEATMKVFDEITQPVLYFDNKALIRYCNAFCQKTLNISQEDFVGLSNLPRFVPSLVRWNPRFFGEVENDGSRDTR